MAEAPENAPGVPSGRTLSGILLVVFLFVVAAGTVLAFLVKSWLPEVASQHGQGIDSLIHYLLVTTGAIFLTGHIVLGVFIWRYSRPDGPAYRPLSRRAEMAWALLPVVLMTLVSEVGVLAMGLPVWSQIYATDGDEKAVQVEVIGKQFEWIVRYPGKDGVFGQVRPELINDLRNPAGLDRKDAAARDDVIVKGVLHLPQGRPAAVRLRTHDVLHSFALPHFRIKQDLVPGFTTRNRFTPVKSGEFEIVCAELCGLGHFRMRGQVVVTPEAEFRAWLNDQVGWFE